MPRSPLSLPLIITQNFGSNPASYPFTNGHPGLDLRSANNDPWFTCVPGVVHIVNKYWPLYFSAFGQPGYGGYGAAICIDWGQADGTFKRFLYGHGKNRILGLDNKNVAEGIKVGVSGNTGKTDGGYHLHFEIRHYYKGAKYYDGTLKLRYSLDDPKNFLRDYKIPFSYK